MKLVTIKNLERFLTNIKNKFVDKSTEQNINGKKIFNNDVYIKGIGGYNGTNLDESDPINNIVHYTDGFDIIGNNKIINGIIEPEGEPDDWNKATLSYDEASKIWNCFNFKNSVRKYDSNILNNISYIIDDTWSDKSYWIPAAWVEIDLNNADIYYYALLEVETSSGDYIYKLVYVTDTFM